MEFKYSPSYINGLLKTLITYKINLIKKIDNLNKIINQSLQPLTVEDINNKITIQYNNQLHLTQYKNILNSFTLYIKYIKEHQSLLTDEEKLLLNITENEQREINKLIKSLINK